MGLAILQKEMNTLELEHMPSADSHTIRSRWSVRLEWAAYGGVIYRGSTGGKKRVLSNGRQGRQEEKQRLQLNVTCCNHTQIDVCVRRSCCSASEGRLSSFGFGRYVCFHR